MLLDSIRSGAARRTARRLAALFALLGAVPAASTQELAGTVTHAGQPVAGAPVEIHRVTQGDRGVIRRLTSDPAGRFSVTLPAPVDSGFTVYFATAIAEGVRYFGPVLHGGQVPERYVVEVFDTTASRGAADSVTVIRRDMILSAAVEGGWEVAELVRMRNPTGRTLVPDREQPIVSVTLPAGATAFQAGEGEESAVADRGAGDLVRVGNNAWVSAPFVPGERDFVFRYRLPAAPPRAELRLGRATDSLTLYLRQPSPEAEVSGLAEGEVFAAEGERFLRFVGAGLAPDATVSIDWRGPAPAPVDPRWAALAIAAVVLAIGGWLAWRRPRAA